MSTAALFVVAKDWKQFKCLSGVLGQWNTLQQKKKKEKRKLLLLMYDKNKDETQRHYTK